MIEKKIHYCWFGRNEKSKLIKKCIESWKKYCPDFEIIEWNEDNFDVQSCKYVKEAYEKKKWAFVSDYCRFVVLYNQGGIYLDTDVELIKPIDEFLGESFTAFESDRLAPGLIYACKKGDIHAYNLMKEYESDKFVLENGEINERTVCVRATDEFKKYGLIENGETQKVDNYMIYSPKYFNPYDLDTGRIVISDETVSIHHYASSWVDGYSKFRGKIYQMICRIFGKKFTEKLRKIVGRR